MIIPRAPGHFSAFGMLFSDLRYDFVRTWFTPLADAPFDEIETHLSPRWSSRAASASRAAGHDAVERRRQARRRHALCRPGARGHRRSADRAVREAGSRRRSSSSSTPCTSCATAPRRRTSGRDRQPAQHRDRADAKAAVERSSRRAAPTPRSAAFRGKRPVYFAGTGFVDTPTYDRAALLAGNRIAGPALIEEHASTTVLHPGDRSTVDAFGNLVIAIGEADHGRHRRKRKARAPIRSSPRSCATASSP